VFPWFLNFILKEIFYKLNTGVKKVAKRKRKAAKKKRK